MDRLALQLSKEEHELLPGDIKAGYRFDQESDSYLLDLAPHGSSPGEAGICASKRARIAEALAGQVVSDLIGKHKLDRERHFSQLLSRIKVGIEPDGKVVADGYLPDGHTRMLSLQVGKLYGDGDDVCRSIALQVQAKALEEKKSSPPEPKIIPFRHPESIVEQRVVNGISVRILAGGDVLLGELRLSAMSSSERMQWQRRLGLQPASVVARSRTFTQQETDVLASLSPHERLKRFRQAQTQQP